MWIKPHLIKLRRGRPFFRIGRYCGCVVSVSCMCLWEPSTAGMYCPLYSTVVEVGMDCGNRAGVPPAYEYLELTLNVGGTVAAISPCTHSMLHAACNALEWGFLWIFDGLSRRGSNTVGCG